MPPGGALFSGQLSLVNELGETIDVQNVKRGESQKLMDTSAYPSGMYIVHLRLDNGESISKKLVISHGE